MTIFLTLLTILFVVISISPILLASANDETLVILPE